MKVQVLMSTYNGEPFLREQIESVLNQSGVSVLLTIRDDGSNDSCRTILQEYDERDNVIVVYGDNVGWRNSFMKLLYMSSDADYYAFCDQDDIWLPDKLLQAVNVIKSMPANTPNLYCSNLNYYKEGEVLGLVEKRKPVLTLQRSLVRSLAAGCTMVFNRELRDMLKNYRPKCVTAHDFWTYQVAMLLGNVYYDMNSYILYRQHDSNQIGANITRADVWKTRVRNARKHFFEDARQFSARELLKLYGDMVTAERKNIVEKIAYYDNNLWSKFSLFFDLSYTMGSCVSNCWLRIRILFGNI